jgi:hypothetical protein
MSVEGAADTPFINQKIEIGKKLGNGNFGKSISSKKWDNFLTKILKKIQGKFTREIGSQSQLH